MSPIIFFLFLTNTRRFISSLKLKINVEIEIIIKLKKKLYLKLKSIKINNKRNNLFFFR